MLIEDSRGQSQQTVWLYVNSNINSSSDSPVTWGSRNQTSTIKQTQLRGIQTLISYSTSERQRTETLEALGQQQKNK